MTLNKISNCLVSNFLLWLQNQSKAKLPNYRFVYVQDGLIYFCSMETFKDIMPDQFSANSIIFIYQIEP